MLGKLFLAFTIVTLVELGLLIQVGQWIGLWPTLALVIVTAYLGAQLARREGTRVVQRIQADLNTMKLPADAALDGAFVLVSAAFLLTPGVLTDIAGFVLLIPVTRAPFHRLAKAKLAKAIAEGTIKVQKKYAQAPPRAPRPGETVRREAVDVSPGSESN